MTNPSADPGAAPAAQRLLDLFAGMWTARAVQTVCELGVPDAVDPGSARAVEDLAARTGCHAPSLYRLLRALASVGVFAERRPGEFEHTDLSRHLRADQPGTLHHFARWSYDWQWHSLTELDHTLRTGRPAFDRVYGADYWTYLTTVKPEAGTLFNAGMRSLAALADAAVATTVDFARFPVIVDVGGGTAGLLVRVLRSAPGPRGILVDLPPAAAEAAQVLDSAGLADRCEAVAGNFFESVPAGADCYVLQRILHDWADDDAVRILRTVRAAMAPASRLLVVEAVLTPGGADPGPVFLDVDMMISTGGRERSEADFRDLLAPAGLRLDSVVRTTSAMSVLEAVPAEGGQEGDPEAVKGQDGRAE